MIVERYKLEEVCIDIYSGGTPSTRKEEYWNGDLKWLSSGETSADFIRDTIQYITDEGVANSSTRLAKKGSVVMACAGQGKTRGQVSYLLDDMYINQSVIAISANQNILNSLYLFYNLKNRYDELRRNSDANGVRGSITTTALKTLPINLPDYSTQTQIAAILSSLDDKIELNSRIASVLEKMMREIYDYWFVQFDFPDENGKPYQSNGGKMVFNPQLKRNIPQGWEVKKLGDLCSLMNGVNYNKEDIGDKKYKIVNVRNITASSLLLDNSNFDAINLKSTLADKYLIENNDILIARSGTPGAVRILPHANNDTIFCGFIIRCQPNNVVYKNYLTYSLKMLEGTNAVVTGGSILKNVSQETLKRNYILLPKNNLLDEFNAITSTIIKEMEYTTKQTQTLTALRDFLLPLLMNGQASVR